MSRNIPEPDPYSELEDEGIPDLQDGTPEQEQAVDPQRIPLPGEQPQAVDDFGTTAEEQADGESLDLRTDREVPEDQAMFGGGGTPTARPADETQPDETQPDETQPDQSDPADDLDAVTEDSGLGPGSDLDTGYEPEEREASGWEAQPEEPSGRVWDEPRPSGRLVAPDEGARPDEEKDSVADEAGPDAGGYSAEESAVRVDPE